MYYYQHVNALREFPVLNLSRPNHDVSVLFAMKELNPKRIESWMKKKNDRNPDAKSVLMSIPVMLHGEISWPRSLLMKKAHWLTTIVMAI